MRKTLIVALALAACGRSASKKQPEGKEDEAAVTPPSLRLPDDAMPTAYRASLALDPAQATFGGHVEIAIDVKRPTKHLWLNAQDLTFEKAVLRRGGEEVVLTTKAEPRNFVALDGDFAPGPATLVIDYRGKQELTWSHGMRKREDRGDAYLVTQFEPDGARRVFPCFDEPSYKVPWTIDLTVPATSLALSNSPVAGEDILADGSKKVTFAPTPPLPSYLIAIAVGPWEAVDAGVTKGGAPMRIIVPRGRTGDAGYAAAETGKLVAALEDYTGIPYPYAKLDQIAVPNGQGGAMENPGLITYGQNWLVIPVGESVTAKRGFLSIAAHELGHIWFGDLVTTRWWDDIWLNEAFATWLSPKVIDMVHPEMDGEIQMVGSRATALDADATGTARKIRQPITEESDIGPAFDSITYQKGATVLHMFETWLGPEVFRKGAQLYLQRHAHGTASGADFLSAMDEASGKDVTAAMGTFLDQAGAPLIDMKLDCTESGKSRLLLRQSRHLARGSQKPPGDPTWKVPVCVTPAGETQPRCTLLEEPTGEIALGDSCPAWIDPNPGGLGYYRSRLAGELQQRLLEQGWVARTRAEQHAILGDVISLVIDGDVELRVLLAVLPKIAKEGELSLLDRIANLLERLAPLAGDASRERFAMLVHATLGVAAKTLGWLPDKGESLGWARVRGSIVPLVAWRGRDVGLGNRAVELAQAWLADHTAVPESLTGAVLGTAVVVDPATMVPALTAALAKETDRRALRQIYGALARTPDPAGYGAALALLLAGDTITDPMLALLRRPDDPAGQIHQFEFLRDNLDALLARASTDYRGSLAPYVCDAARRDEVAAMLDGKFASMREVGTLRVAQIKEAMDRCVAERTFLGGQLDAFLGGAPP